MDIKKKKKNPLTTMHKRCWALWSSKIREEEKYVCFTCGKQGDKYNTEAGHYAHSSQDFVRENIHCQCTRCNRYLHGNLGVYATKLADLYGMDKVKELDRNKFKPKKYSIKELNELYLLLSQTHIKA